MADKIKVGLEFEADGSQAIRTAAEVQGAVEQAQGAMVQDALKASQMKLAIADKEMANQFRLGDLSIQQYRAYLDKRLAMTENTARMESQLRMEAAKLADIEQERGLKNISVGAAAAVSQLGQLGPVAGMAGQGLNVVGQMAQAVANKMGAAQIATIGLTGALGIAMMGYQALKRLMEEDIEKQEKEIERLKEATEKTKALDRNRLEWEYRHNIISAEQYAIRIQKWRDNNTKYTDAWIAWDNKLQALEEEAKNKRIERERKRQEEMQALAASEAALDAAIEAQKQAKIAEQERLQREDEKAAAEWKKTMYADDTAYQLEQLAIQYEMYRQFLEDKLRDDENYTKHKAKLEEWYAKGQKKIKDGEAKDSKALIEFKLQLTKGLLAFSDKAMDALISGNKAGIAHMVADTLKLQGKQWVMEGTAGMLKGIITGNAAAIGAGAALIALGGGAAAVGAGLTALQRRDTATNLEAPRFDTPTFSGGGPARAEGGVETRSGAEPVSRGQTIINYSSILRIDGNVIGLDNLQAIFDEWNFNSLRALGRA